MDVEIESIQSKEPANLYTIACDPRRISGHCITPWLAIHLGQVQCNDSPKSSDNNWFIVGNLSVELSNYTQSI